MSDLEVRQLRYFVAVAEELHFGRAASRLAMAQPPLSRAIRDIERQLGVRLLERTTRQVTLTPAGEVLLREARTALEAVTAAGHRTQRAGSATPKLRLAMKADYDAGLLPRILALYQGEEAALPLELLLGGRGEQVTALREGRADVAMMPAPFDERDLDVEPLITEPRLAAVAAVDPLAAHVSLRLSDFVGRVLPDGSPAESGGGAASPAAPAPTSAPTSASAAGPTSAASPSAASGRGVAGRAPGSAVGAVAPRAGLDLAQIFNLVELGSIVWFLPASVARRHPRSGVAYRVVADLPPSTLVVAWPRDSRSPAVAAFVRAAIAVAATAPVMDDADVQPIVSAR